MRTKLPNKEDVESSIKILFSNDYDKFKTIEGNRDIILRKIKKLKLSIEGGLDLLKYCPIIVNDNFEIIDGQHRFTVSKELGQPIFYVVLKKQIHVKQVAEMNCNTDKWKSRDYIECFAKQENKNYIDLLRYISETGLNHSTCAQLLMKGNVIDGGFISLHIKLGTFKVKYANVVDSFLSWLNTIDSTLVEKPKSRPYIGAMRTLYDSKDFDINVFIKKIEKTRKALKHQTGVKQYLHEIENIYNFNNSKRVTIY